MKKTIKERLELRRLHLLDAIKSAQEFLEAAAAQRNTHGFVGFTGEDDEHLVPVAYLVAAALQWKQDNEKLLGCMPPPPVLKK